MSKIIKTEKETFLYFQILKENEMISPNTVGSFVFAANVLEVHLRYMIYHKIRVPCTIKIVVFFSALQQSSCFYFLRRYTL